MVIPDRLYIRGKFRDLPKEEKLAALRGAGITVVICTLLRIHDQDLVDCDGLIYEVHPVPDGKTVPVRVYESVASRVVAYLTAGHTVLVHCWGGRNRSGLVVALALRRWEGISGAEAYARVRQAKSDALRNPVFAEFLQRLP